MVDRAFTPKRETPHTTRTEWLTSRTPFLAQVSIKLQKTCECEVFDYWHTHCQKGDTEGEQGMKKGLLSIFCLLALIFTAIPAGAQTRTRRFDNRRYEQRVADTRYRSEAYRYRDGRRYRDRDYWDRDRSFWDRHRDKLTTAAGAGGGAVIGGLVGGKKGAIIGAIAGAGGAALYTYKLRDKDRRRY